MRLPSRLHPAALLGALALAWGPLPANADGPGPAPGNALNPAPVNPITAGRWMDEEGLGTRIPAARTPSGQFYNVPLDPGPEPEKKDPKAWSTTGFIEFGGLNTSGDDHAAGWLNYKDLRSGGYLNLFALSAEKTGEARYVEASGGAVGMRDQFYRFQAGRYNDWKVSAFFDGTPQAFTSSYRSLWSGTGTGSLTLATLTPGGTTNAATTQANIQNALATTDNSTLEVLRKTAGVRLDKNLGELWKVFASFTTQKREGARPFGAVFGGGGGGGNVEITEPIDYQTHDLLAGVQYSGPTSSFNLRASASIFHNNIDTFTFQNPLYITTNGSTGLSPTAFTQGRFDLPPDNVHYNVRGEYARPLPDFYRGNLTATVALGSMRQNDSFIAPTENTLAGGTVTAGGASLANNWNTTAALSQSSAHARIDTALADFGLSFKPMKGLDVRGRLRYYETDNSTQYISCNPLTGQWGRILNDGSGLSLVGANTTAGANPAGTSANAFNAAGCDIEAVRALHLVPNTGNIPVMTVPNDYRQVNASVTADYRLGRTSSVNAILERESFNREVRERDRTWEDKLKLAYIERGAIDGTIRISYEHTRRDGSEYNPNPYQSYLSASFGPTPASNGVAVQSWFHSISQFRSFDLADRRQDILNGRVNFAVLPTVDAALTVQAKDAQFPSLLGRSGHQRSNSFTLDVNYQAGSSGELYGFYSWQGAQLEQKGVHPNNCVIGSTYYFFSDGQVLAAIPGAAAPAAPAGTTLVATQGVDGGNWMDVCGMASATSPLFPDSRGWSATSRDRNDVIGFGFKYDFGRAKLDTNFTRTLGRTRIGYTYNAAALGLSAVQAALAGDGWSDLTFAQTTINASLMVPLKPNLSLRFLLRHESGRIRDWHYDGVVVNPMPATNAAYLDGGPQDYRATMVGIMVQVRI